jgi:TrmH family RNA methyltransferase
MITSTSNPHIKEIRRLRDRKFRNESGYAYVEGIRLVYEALIQGTDVSEIILAPEITKSEISEEIVKLAKERLLTITEVSKSVFEYLSSKDGPKGIAAIVKQNWGNLELINNPGKYWVALFEVADPGNLGTILRSVDGAGGEGVILIGNCSDPYDPTAIRASMGAIFTKKIIRCCENDFIMAVSSSEKILIGTSDNSKVNFHDLDYKKDTILLMGSERQGIPLSLLRECNEIVSIPMAGSCDSLNLAVATSIILYKISRCVQKRK